MDALDRFYWSFIFSNTFSHRLFAMLEPGILNVVDTVDVFSIEATMASGSVLDAVFVDGVLFLVTHRTVSPGSGLGLVSELFWETASVIKKAHSPNAD